MDFDKCHLYKCAVREWEYSLHESKSNEILEV